MEQINNFTPLTKINDSGNPSLVQAPSLSGKKNNNFLPVILLLVGLIVVSYFVFTSLVSKKPTNLKEQAGITPAPFFLTVDQPKGDTLAVNGENLVAGKTLPKTVVVAYTNSDETFIESGDDGSFETSVVVGDGDELVKVTSYSDSGEELSQTFQVKNNVDVLGNSNKTDNGIGNDKKEENSVKGNDASDNQPNNQKIKEETSLGDTETPKSSQGKSQQLLQNKNGVKNFEKIGVKNLKNILSKASTDSAALLSEGNLKKMDVQQATAGAQMKRHAVSGVITSISDGGLTIAHQIQRERTYMVYYNSSTVITNNDKESTSSAQLAVNVRIAAVGELFEKGILAKRIHVIPGKAVGVFNKNPVATEESEIILSPSPVSSSTPTLVPEVTTEATSGPTLLMQ